MSNHMKEVAEMLGLCINEEFYITTYSNVFRITEDGLEYHNKIGWHKDVAALSQILSGREKVVKKPFKPEEGATYFYVLPSGDVCDTIWFADGNDICRYKIGNCYRTVEGAEEATDKWKRFYASMELIEWDK